MFNQNPYFRTDVASERCADQRSGALSGIKVTVEEHFGFSVTKTEILNDEGAAAIGKPIGSYISVSLGKIWLESDERRERCAFLVGKTVRELLFSSGVIESVTVCGLGNRHIISDAVGSLCVKELNANLHIMKSDPEIFGLLGSYPYSVLEPGVTGQTGIEAAEIIKGAAERIKPSALICIDALASRSVDRLGVTVQISDTGICPGSGIGNHRSAIDKKALGLPVIAIGLPTVVSSSTLVLEALEKAGITEISDELEAVLHNGRDFFVTMKDADTVVYEVSKIIASAIRIALSKNINEPSVI